MNFLDALKIVSTDMKSNLLKKYDFILSTGQEMSFFARSQQEADEMFIKHVRTFCNHPEFHKGVCVDCDYECEHQEIDENTCLYCGENIEPNDPRSEPECWEDR